jgi:hypothetical protein
MKIRLERLNRDEAVVVRERGAFGLIGRKALYYVEISGTVSTTSMRMNFAAPGLAAVLPGPGFRDSGPGNGAGCHRHPLFADY